MFLFLQIETEITLHFNEQHEYISHQSSKRLDLNQVTNSCMM